MKAPFKLVCSSGILIHNQYVRNSVSCLEAVKLLYVREMIYLLKFPLAVITNDSRRQNRDLPKTSEIYAFSVNNIAI